MAIYHFSVQAISRGKGQSAVAAAAYRSGERLVDENSGEVKFYKRDVEPDTMILAPNNAPEWVQDRQRLWNEVEKIESNKNSRLAREINVALPIELSHGQQKELIKNYVKEQFVDKGMVADIAIHRDDKNNPHAHIMLTIRPFEETGEWLKQKSKKEYILDENGNFTFTKKGEKRSRKVDLIGWDKKELVQEWRKEWSNHANRMLEREGINVRIDHRSHKERGLETLPTQHLGHIASAMEKRGIQTEKGNINRDRQEYNALVVDIQEYRKEKQELQQENSTAVEQIDLKNASKVLKADPSLENIDKRYKQLDKWAERLNKNDSYIRWKDKAIEGAFEHFSWIDSLEKQIQESEKKIENISWLNPMKLKENKTFKDRLEQNILQAKAQIISHTQQLNYYREKLGFSNEKEFNEVKAQHEIERPALLEKNKKNRQHIQYERDVLKKAENALKNDFVRRVASLYPERPEMAYMSFKTAINVMEFNKSYGKGEIIPVERIPEFKEQMQLKEGGLSLFNALMNGINQAERGMFEERKNTQEIPPKSKKKKKQHSHRL